MRSSTLGIGCLIASVCLAVPVLAADEAGHGDGKGKHEHLAVEVKYIEKGDKSKGEKDHEVKREFDMSIAADANALLKVLTDPKNEIDEIHKHEKLDIFQIKRWDLGIWSFVIFILLFLALKKFAWKPMLEGLTKREERIREALDLAEKTRREALGQQEILHAKLKESASEVALMIEEGRKDAQLMKETMVAEAKAEIQTERDRLHREVDTAKEQALQEIWQSAVSLATAMSTKAMGRSIGEEDHRRFLDESLADLKDAGTGFSKRKLSGAGGL